MVSHSIVVIVLNIVLLCHGVDLTVWTFTGNYDLARMDISGDIGSDAAWTIVRSASTFPGYIRVGSTTQADVSRDIGIDDSGRLYLSQLTIVNTPTTPKRGVRLSQLDPTTPSSGTLLYEAPYNGIASYGESYDSVGPITDHLVLDIDAGDVPGHYITELLEPQLPDVSDPIMHASGQVSSSPDYATPRLYHDTVRQFVISANQIWHVNHNTSRLSTLVPIDTDGLRNAQAYDSVRGYLFYADNNPDNLMWCCARDQNTHVALNVLDLSTVGDGSDPDVAVYSALLVPYITDPDGDGTAPLIKSMSIVDRHLYVVVKRSAGGALNDYIYAYTLGDSRDQILTSETLLNANAPLDVCSECYPIIARMRNSNTGPFGSPPSPAPIGAPSSDTTSASCTWRSAFSSTALAFFILYSC